MSRHNYLNYYRPTFVRHLHSLAISGFYARELDADDHAFIEQVRERGSCWCGTLGNTVPTAFSNREQSPLLEELGYWEHPWAVEHGVPRRVGPVRKVHREPSETDQHRKEQWLARRRQRRQDRAIEAAELQREQKAWDKAQAKLAKEREKRLKQTMEADIEWEQEHKKSEWNPPYTDDWRPRSYNLPQRHYVPEWKRLPKPKMKEQTEPQPLVVKYGYFWAPPAPTPPKPLANPLGCIHDCLIKYGNKTWTVHELMATSGHTDYKTFFRYYEMIVDATGVDLIRILSDGSYEA
jgi:hypothetical protein